MRFVEFIVLNVLGLSVFGVLRPWGDPDVTRIRALTELKLSTPPILNLNHHHELYTSLSIC